MIGAFSPLIFKVILERNVLIAILVLCFCSSSPISSSFYFFLCGLIIFFSGMFVLLSFGFLYIYWRFLICGYNEVHLCWCIPISTYFKLTVIYVQTHCKRLIFLVSSPILYFFFSLIRAFYFLFIFYYSINLSHL